MELIRIGIFLIILASQHTKVQTAVTTGTCSDYRFPKIYGGNSGDTSIEAIDSDSNTGDILMAGFTNDPLIASVSMSVPQVPLMGILKSNQQKFAWVKQFSNNFAYSGGTFQPFTIVSAKYSDSATQCIFVTHSQYFTVIILSASDGSFLKALQDSTLTIYSGTVAYMETANDRLVLAFTTGGNGFVTRFQGVVSGSPSVAMSPWPMYSQISSFVDIMQGKAYANTIAGYIYYISGTFTTTSGYKKMMVMAYESGNNNALWFMAEQTDNNLHQAGINKITRLQSGPTEYIFGCGESLDQTVSKGILMIRFVSNGASFPNTPIKQYFYQDPDLSLQIQCMGIFVNTMTTGDQFQMIMQIPSNNLIYSMMVTISDATVVRQVITTQNQQILKYALFDSNSKILTSGKTKNYNGCLTDNSFYRGFINLHDPLQSCVFSNYESNMLSFENANLIEFGGSLSSWTLSSASKTGSFAFYTTANPTDMLNTNQADFKCCFTFSPSIVQPTLVFKNKLYYVGNDNLKFSIPSFTIEDSCNDIFDATFTVSIKNLNTNLPCSNCGFITNFYDTLSSKLVMTVYTIDTTKAGIKYEITVKGTLPNLQYNSIKFELEVLLVGQTPMTPVPMITVSSSIITQTITVQDDVFSIILDFFTYSDTSLFVNYVMTYTDGTPYDSVLFFGAYDTSDSAKVLVFAQSDIYVGTYSLLIKARYTQTPVNTYDCQVQIDITIVGNGVTTPGSPPAAICSSINVKVPTIPDQKLQMYSKSSLFFSFQSWYSNDLATCPYTYSATLSNGDILPLFVIFMPVTRQFQVSANNPQLVEGTYTIQISSLFSGTTYTTLFKLKVSCTLTSLQVTQPSQTIMHLLGSPISYSQILLTVNDFSQNPNCGYPITYKASLTTSQLPSWLKFTYQTFTLSESTKSMQSGDYIVKVQGKLQTSDGKVFTNFYYWTISVVDKMVDQWLPESNIECVVGYESEFEIKNMGEGTVYIDVQDESREFVTFKSVESGKGKLKVSPTDSFSVGSKYEIQVYTNQKTNNGTEYRIIKRIKIILIATSDSHTTNKTKTTKVEGEVVAEKVFKESVKVKTREQERKYQEFKKIVKVEGSLSFVTETGAVTIKFNQNMDINPDYAKIDSKVLILEVIPSRENESNKQKVKFKWETTGIDENSIQIQLYFDQPLLISSSNNFDVLQVTFFKNTLFKSASDPGHMIKQFTRLTKSIPKQVVYSHIKALQQIQGSTSTTVSSQVASNIIVNVLLSGSLQMVWGMINSLQLITILPLMNVDFPGNAQSMFSALNQVFSFNFIDFSSVQNRLFTFMEDDPLNENFNEYGYSSSNAIILIGNEYYITWIIIMMQLSFTLLGIIARIFNKDGIKVMVYLSKSFFPHMLLRTFLEGSLNLSICSLINVRVAPSGNVSETISYLTSVVVIAIVIILPLFNSFVVVKRVLRDGEWQAMESFYGDLKRDKVSLHYQTFFVLHRLAIGYTLVYMTDFLSVQMLSLVFLNLSMIIYVLWVRPFEEPTQNDMEIFNQVITFVSVYSLYIFCDIGDNQDDTTIQELRYNSGWFLIAAVGFLIFVNSLIILRGMLLNLLEPLKRLLRRLKTFIKGKHTFVGRKKVVSITDFIVKEEDSPTKLDEQNTSTNQLTTQREDNKHINHFAEPSNRVKMQPLVTTLTNGKYYRANNHSITSIRDLLPEEYIEEDIEEAKQREKNETFGSPNQMNDFFYGRNKDQENSMVEFNSVFMQDSPTPFEPPENPQIEHVTYTMG